MFIPVEFNRRIARARKKEANCAILCHLHRGHFYGTFIEDYSRPISVRDSLSYGKKRTNWGCKLIQKVACMAGAKR